MATAVRDVLEAMAGLVEDRKGLGSTLEGSRFATSRPIGDGIDGDDPQQVGVGNPAGPALHGGEEMAEFLVGVGGVADGLGHFCQQGLAKAFSQSMHGHLDGGFAHPQFAPHLGLA